MYSRQAAIVIAAISAVVVLATGAPVAASGSAPASPTLVAVVPPPDPDDQPTPFVHPGGVHDPACVIEVQPGDSLSLISEAMPDTAVSYFDLAAENGITDADHIETGQFLDICVGNQLDDITGEGRDGATDIVDEAVAAQQRQINALFAGTGMPELLVDGVSGPLTRQQLCAFRSAFGLPISRADMVPGSAEERQLMATNARPAYDGAPERWLMIDKTCQVMFVGDSRSLVFIFPTSTGEEGYETRDQDAVRAFRFDPALDNDGWHDSTTYPVAADNPLNGNMYKPLYFDNGQAIHGSYNVPPAPASKGCARLLVEHQDALVAWLGLSDATSPVWSADRIDLIVNVRGQFVADPPEE